MIRSINDKGHRYIVESDSTDGPAMILKEFAMTMPKVAAKAEIRLLRPQVWEVTLLYNESA